MLKNCKTCKHANKETCPGCNAASIGNDIYNNFEPDENLSEGLLLINETLEALENFSPSVAIDMYKHLCLKLYKEWNFAKTALNMSCKHNLLDKFGKYMKGEDKKLAERYLARAAELYNKTSTGAYKIEE